MANDRSHIYEHLGTLNTEREKLLRDKLKETSDMQQAYEKNYFLQVDSFRFHNQVFGTNKRGIEPQVYNELLDRQLDSYAEELLEAQLEEHEDKEPELPEPEDIQPDKQEHGTPEKKADNVVMLKDHFKSGMRDIGERKDGAENKDQRLIKRDADLERTLQQLEGRWAKQKQDAEAPDKTQDNVIQLKQYFKDQKGELTREPEYADPDKDMDRDNWDRDEPRESYKADYDDMEKDWDKDDRNMDDYSDKYE